MFYSDLRGWIGEIEKFGELKRVPGANWDLEMGATTDLYARNEPYPAILFDEIKDYPLGHRVLVGVHHPSLKRQCLTTHLPLDYDRHLFIQARKERLDNQTFIPPRVVPSGPDNGEHHLRRDLRTGCMANELAQLAGVLKDRQTRVTSVAGGCHVRAGSRSLDA